MQRPRPRPRQTGMARASRPKRRYESTDPPPVGSKLPNCTPSAMRGTAKPPTPQQSSKHRERSHAQEPCLAARKWAPWPPHMQANLDKAWKAHEQTKMARTGNRQYLAYEWIRIQSNPGHPSVAATEKWKGRVQRGDSREVWLQRLPESWQWHVLYPDLQKSKLPSRLPTTPVLPCQPLVLLQKSSLYSDQQHQWHQYHPPWPPSTWLTSQSIGMVRYLPCRG